MPCCRRISRLTQLHTYTLKTRLTTSSQPHRFNVYILDHPSQIHPRLLPSIIAPLIQRLAFWRLVSRVLFLFFLLLFFSTTTLVPLLLLFAFRGFPPPPSSTRPRHFASADWAFDASFLGSYFFSSAFLCVAQPGQENLLCTVLFRCVLSFFSSLSSVSRVQGAAFWLGGRLSGCLNRARSSSPSPSLYVVCGRERERYRLGRRGLVGAARRRARYR